MSSKWDRTRTLTGDGFGEAGYTYTYSTSNAESLDRLQRSARALDQLLTRARKKDLPAMSWRVNEFALSGEYTAADTLPPADKRARFMAWADELGAEWKEHTYSSAPGGPTTQLRGRAEIPAPSRPHLIVVVGLLAEWYVDEAMEQAGLEQGR